MTVSLLDELTIEELGLSRRFANGDSSIFTKSKCM